MNANLAGVVDAAAATAPDGAALVVEGSTTTFAELQEDAEAAAAALAARGVVPGDRVALVLPNGRAFLAAYFGALRLGAVVVPLNILLSPAEVEARLAIAEPAVVVDREHPLDLVAGASREPADRRQDDPAVLLFTSGTSGVPKAAVLTHGSLRAAATNAQLALGFRPDDVVLGAAPFSHVLGQSVGIVATFLAGGCVAAMQRFEAEAVLELMARSGTTVFLGVPTMCIALSAAVAAGGTLPPLRIAHVGGAPLPVEVGTTFEQTFGAPVVEGYGLTELSGIATTFAAGRTRKPGSVGSPLGDTELRIVDLDGEPLPVGERGEVQLRGSSVVRSYWRSDDSPVDADGWLATGDIGYVDGDGDLFLVDRKKELIIRGGYNVYPREVEEVLFAHPDVREVAVVGVPHETLGEEVAALVVLHPGREATVEDLRGFARERVAAYKYPRIVALVDDLPRGPTGKVLKRAIDRDALARLASH